MSAKKCRRRVYGEGNILPEFMFHDFSLTIGTSTKGYGEFSAEYTFKKCNKRTERHTFVRRKCEYLSVEHSVIALSEQRHHAIVPIEHILYRADIKQLFARRQLKTGPRLCSIK